MVFPVIPHPVGQEAHIKGRIVAAVLDIGDFEAGFGRASGEIGMRIGGGAKGCAVVIAECRIVDISISDVRGTVWPENPIGVRYGGVVKKRIAGRRDLVKVSVVIPSADNHAAVGNIVHEIVTIPILDGVPLAWIERRPDEVTVVLVGRCDAVQHIVPVLRDFYRLVNNS